MAFTVFKETWLPLIRNIKNRLTVVLALVAIIAYSAFFLPRWGGFNTIDLKQLEQSITSTQGIMASAIENENFGVNIFTGKSAYVEAKRKYENNRVLLAAVIYDKRFNRAGCRSDSNGGRSILAGKWHFPCWRTD